MRSKRPAASPTRSRRRIASARSISNLHANFELAKNTYKPYPCGIVAHPAIDAAVALAARIGSVDAVESVVVHCNPLVPELMGNLTPGDGLQARFSAVHGVTMGLRDGRVGLAQYDDALVIAADVAALRARVRLEPDAGVPRASARLVVKLTDGTSIEETTTHARGSLERPLTDAELNAKAEALVEPLLAGRHRRAAQGDVRFAERARSVSADRGGDDSERDSGYTRSRPPN